jgi:hypothetical protein
MTDEELIDRIEGEMALLGDNDTEMQRIFFLARRGLAIKPGDDLGNGLVALPKQREFICRKCFLREEEGQPVDVQF